VDPKTNTTGDAQCEVEAIPVKNDDRQQLGSVDKLPPVDTTDAANVSATR